MRGRGKRERERARRETRSGAYGTQIDQRDAQGARQQETETERKLWKLMLKVEKRIEERIAERKNTRWIPRTGSGTNYSRRGVGGAIGPRSR